MAYFYYFARKLKYPLYTIIERLGRNYQSLKKINKLYRHAKLHFAEHNVSKSSQILEEKILPMLKGLPKGSSSEWKKIYNEFHADLWQFRAALIAVQSGSAEAVKFLNDLGENSPEVPILRDKNFQIKQAAAIKRGIPPIVVATQPKSGSQFLYNSLAIGLDCPFIEIQVPIYASHCLVPSWTRELRKGGAVSKSHLLPREDMINELLRQGQNKVWVHLRDPRQTVLSFIHHDVKFSKNEDGGIPNLYATTRELMFPPDQLANRVVYGADLLNSIEKTNDCEESGANISLDVEDRIFEMIKRQASYGTAWKKFSERYSDRIDVKFGYYEDMLTDKTKYIRDVLSFFEVPESKFDSSKAFSEPAVMNTHFRRGDVDEWRRVYSEALVDRIEKFAKTGFVERYIR